MDTTKLKILDILSFLAISAILSMVAEAGFSENRLTTVETTGDPALFLPIVLKDYPSAEPGPTPTTTPTSSSFTPTPTTTATPTPTAGPITCPQAGTWMGIAQPEYDNYITFDVSTPPDCRVASLKITYRATCTGYYSWVDHYKKWLVTIPISNNHFEIGGEDTWVKGDFTSLTEASGTWAASFYYGPGYGTCSASGNWTAIYLPLP